MFANEGCPECPAGEFGIDAIAAFPNVIGAEPGSVDTGCVLNYAAMAA